MRFDARLSEVVGIVTFVQMEVHLQNMQQKRFNKGFVCDVALSPNINLSTVLTFAMSLAINKVSTEKQTLFVEFLSPKERHRLVTM